MTEANPIRAYRAERQITLEELASEIGVRRNTIWRWEQGRVPDPDKWPAIIRATSITRDQLIQYATSQKYAEVA
jgi:DNA-binding XRE family transcriptional regulator